MKGQTILLLKLILLIGSLLANFCDEDTTVQVQEGNLGQTTDFNWLGELHTYLHDGSINVTGIVLIKIKFALVNADDVGRIPIHIFKTASRAIFLVASHTPWYVVPASYVTHPEYGHTTFSSIAIIELNLAEEQDYPLSPICLPSTEDFISYEHLYLTGFTKENEKLEKVIYKIQYAEKEVCEKYYKTEKSRNFIPSAYVCGYAPNMDTQCVWDNGMSLVSNVSGYFNLIGFGVGGPGCASPSRFVHLFLYSQWIDSIVCPYQVHDTDECKRTDEDTDFIPIHDLFTLSGRRQLTGDLHHNPGPLKHHIIERTKDDKCIRIAAFTDKKYDSACPPQMALVHTESYDLKAKVSTGVVTYKLSLWALTPGLRSCIRITADCDEHSRLTFSFKEGEPPDTTPKELSSLGANYEVINRIADIEREDSALFRRINDSDLYITIEFTNRVILKFEVFAEPEQRSSHSLSLRDTTTTRKPFRRRTKHRPFWGFNEWQYKM